MFFRILSVASVVDIFLYEWIQLPLRSRTILVSEKVRSNSLPLRDELGPFTIWIPPPPRLSTLLKIRLVL